MLKVFTASSPSSLWCMNTTKLLIRYKNKPLSNQKIRKAQHSIEKQHSYLKQSIAILTSKNVYRPI